MPRIKSSESEVEPAKFGRNVRDLRKVRGWSIDALAKRAGVASYTVLRIEQGYPSTRNTQIRIAYALDTVVERLGRTAVTQRPDIAFHTPRDDYWIGLLDWRPVVPEDNAQAIQSPDERGRLGRLGFVTQFVKMLKCRMPKGKLVAGVIEAHGDLPASSYLGGEIFAYALKGDSKIVFGAEEFALPEGSATTFDCTKPFFFAPLASGADKAPIQVLYVRLEETEPISSRRPKRGRTVEGEFEVWADPGGGVPVEVGAPKRARNRKRRSVSGS